MGRIELFAMNRDKGCVGNWLEIQCQGVKETKYCCFEFSRKTI